jgi:hypothetical protein
LLIVSLCYYTILEKLYVTIHTYIMSPSHVPLFVLPITKPGGASDLHKEYVIKIMVLINMSSVSLSETETTF